MSETADKEKEIIDFEGKKFIPVTPPLISIGSESIRFSAERSISAETPLEISGREAASDLVLASYQGSTARFAVEISYLHNPSAIVAALNQ
jgi:hypothetical protein